MRADRFYERTAVQNYDDDDDEEAPSWLKNLPPGSDIDIERIRWMGLSEGQRRMRTWNHDKMCIAQYEPTYAKWSECGTKLQSIHLLVLLFLCLLCLPHAVIDLFLLSVHYNQ